jgi:hypothetical protein
MASIFKVEEEAEKESSVEQAGLCLHTGLACHLLSRRFLARIILRCWRWRRYVAPKRRLNFNWLHDVISQKSVVFITTARRTSDPAYCFFFACIQGLNTPNMYRGERYFEHKVAEPNTPVYICLTVFDMLKQAWANVLQQLWYAYFSPFMQNERGKIIIVCSESRDTSCFEGGITRMPVA